MVIFFIQGRYESNVGTGKWPQFLIKPVCEGKYFHKSFHVRLKFLREEGSYPSNKHAIG